MFFGITFQMLNIVYYFLKFINLFLKKGEGKEKEKERKINI